MVLHANFLETPTGEVRRRTLPRTLVNRPTIHLSIRLLALVTTKNIPSAIVSICTNPYPTLVVGMPERRMHKELRSYESAARRPGLRRLGSQPWLRRALS